MKKPSVQQITEPFIRLKDGISGWVQEFRRRQRKEQRRRKIQKKRLSPEKYKIWVRRRKLKNAKAIAIMVATFVIMLAVLVGIVKAFAFVGSKIFTSRNAPMQIEIPDITKPAFQEKDISIGSTGCMLWHGPVIEGGRIGDDDKFDFDYMYQFVKPYYSSPDFMTCEFEGSLTGYDYSGYPDFHTPDEAMDAIKNSGVDLLLMASNHIYDGGSEGFHRTLEVLQKKGITFGGTRVDETKPRYYVADLDGVKVGFVNYVYEEMDDPSQTGVNKIAFDTADIPLINTFKYHDLDAFYAEMQQNIDGMKNDGAQFIVTCMHWGDEYHLQESKQQDAIAQKLCDMGVNALIGGHPHCEQPTDVFTSTDGKSEMFCVFSVGNAMSNQRRALISEMPTGHTEDGVEVLMNLHQDAYGEVSLTGVELLPTWVYLDDDGKYYILPLDDVDNIESMTGFSGIKSEAQASFDRTMSEMADGLALAKQTFGDMDTVAGITIKTKRNLPAQPVSAHVANASGKANSENVMDDADDESYDSYDGSDYDYDDYDSYY